jgi:hypothetical protein
MKPIQIISQDLFDKVRSRFQNLEMGDSTGAVTIDPAEALFFDFDFVIEGTNLGRVSMSLADLGSLKVYYSQGITENHDDPVKTEWFKFLKEMRFFAMRRLLRFDTRDIAKSNLDKNDFQHLATTQPPKDDEMTTMNESMWNNKSSKKTSRAVKGGTEVIVRHHKPVDEMYSGSRSQRKNIKAIFIQNKDGERFKYPFIHTAGAFAMAQHVDHGGVPHDPAGKAIIKMSEEIAKLGEFQRKTHSMPTLHQDATGIRERAIGRLNELKTQMECLGKRQHYQNWISGFQAPVDETDTVLDDVTMEQYKQKFTQTSFQEELSSYFPLIHKIMSEENTINLESYVEENMDESFDVPGSAGKVGQGRGFPDNAFAEWAESIENKELTPDQVGELKQSLEQLPDGKLQLGADGQTAIEFFAPLIDIYPDLADRFEQAAQAGEEQDSDAIKNVFTPWCKENCPQVLTQLGIEGGEEHEVPEPETPDEVGAQPEDAEQAMENEDGMGTGRMMPTQEDVIREVAKLVKSRYNKDNPEVGPFNGKENIALDVKKKCAEMFGDEIAEQAESLAMQFMDKLSEHWQQKHGGVDQSDGLARLKELLNNVRAKVEGIGDQGQGGTNFNKNIMSAEDVKKSEIPASQRKEKGGDWKVSHKDLEKENPSSHQRQQDKKTSLGMKEDITDILKLSGLAK